MEELREEHWPILIAAVLMNVLIQISKRHFLTHERAAKSKIIDFLRDTLAAHPAILGTAVGFIPGAPITPWGGLSAGAISLFIYGIMKAVFKRFGAKMPGIPGLTDPPGPPSPPEPPDLVDTNPGSKRPKAP